MLRLDFCLSISRDSQCKVALPQETGTQTQSFFTAERIIAGWYYRSSQIAVIQRVHTMQFTIGFPPFQRCGPVNNAALNLVLNWEFFLFSFSKTPPKANYSRSLELRSEASLDFFGGPRPLLSKCEVDIISPLFFSAFCQCSSFQVDIEYWMRPIIYSALKMEHDMRASNRELLVFSLIVVSLHFSVKK